MRETKRSKPKNPEGPCESYAGNLCSGFGGDLICWICGWDKYYHGAGIRAYIQEHGVTVFDEQ